MSQHRLVSADGRYDVRLGWDRPLGTFFVSVRDRKEDDLGELVEWLGASPGDDLTAEDVLEVAARYAEIPEGFAEALERERDAEGTRAGPSRPGVLPPYDPDRTVEYAGHRCRVLERDYPTPGRRAVVLMDERDREWLVVATVNIPEIDLPPGLVIVRNTEENEGVLEVLEEAGVLRRTPHTIEGDFVSFPVCELAPRGASLDDRAAADKPSRP